MAVIFEKIDTGEVVRVDAETAGRFFEAKLAALVNSSDMSPNADRGQDFGWRLHPEQKAVIERWKEDPATIEKVSTYTQVQIDDLTDRNFLAYYVYQESLGKSPVKIATSERKEAQASYEERVAAAKAGKPKTKAELLEEAKELGLEFTTKATVADITKAIKEARTAPTEE